MTVQVGYFAKTFRKEASEKTPLKKQGQERLYRMFGTDSVDNLCFSVSPSQVGKGLDEQLQVQS